MREASNGTKKAFLIIFDSAGSTSWWEKINELYGNSHVKISYQYFL